MDFLSDIEDLTDFNVIRNENVYPLQSSQDSFTAVLDKMCETLDANELENTENIDKRPNDLDELELTAFGISNEDCVFNDDTINIEKTYIEEKSDDSVRPKSCILSAFDEKEVVGNMSDVQEVDHKVHNNTDVCTADTILSPTAIALAEFNEIFNAACFDKYNLPKLEETKIVERVEKQYDDEVINLNEFDDILNDNSNKFKETRTDDIILEKIEESGNTTKSLMPAIEDKNNNLGKEDLRTRTNDIAVLKEQLKVTEHSQVLKTVEIDLTNETSSSETDDGYDSSDFEFITEDQAKKAGIYVKGKKIPDTLQKPSQPSNEYNVASNYESLPDHIKYHRNRYLRCRVANFKNRESHVIPEGDNLLHLFRTLPIVNGVYYSTNKHVLPARNMAFSRDGFGFTYPEINEEENSEFKHEADETAKKIRFLYPAENRKRPRRFK